jgi:hypothetical protein
MNDTPLDETATKFSVMTGRQVMQILVFAGAVGAIAWGLTVLLDKYVFQAILCSGEAAKCNMSFQYGAITASIIAGILMLLGLVRLGVFRPLLVVIASVASLWGLIEIVQVWPWYYAVLAMIVLFAFAYGAYSWIARIRNFWIALGVSVLLLVAVRFLITS